MARTRCGKPMERPCFNKTLCIDNTMYYRTRCNQLHWKFVSNRKASLVNQITKTSQGWKLSICLWSSASGSKSIRSSFELNLAVAWRVSSEMGSNSTQMELKPRRGRIQGPFLAIWRIVRENEGILCQIRRPTIVPKMNLFKIGLFRLRLIVCKQIQASKQKT